MSTTRRITAAVGGLLTAGLAISATVILSAPAGADTDAGYVVTRASIGTQTNVAPGGTLSGLLDGSPIHIVATAPGGASKLMSVTTRQCVDGATISSFPDFRPSIGGFCYDFAPAGSTGNATVDFLTDDPNTTADFTVKAVTGSKTLSPWQGDGAAPTITCDATHPCELWLRQVAPAAPNGESYVHYELRFAGAPAAPTVGSPINASGGSASVTVTPNANTGNAPITRYEVTATPSGGGSPIVVSGATSPVSVTGLALGATYTFTAKVENTAVDGTTHFVSPASTGVTATVTVPAPSNLTAAPGNTVANLSWTAATGASSYVVSYCARTTPGTACTPTTEVAVSGATTKLLTGLTNGTTYDANVKAVFGDVRSAASNTVTFTPAPPPPDPCLPPRGLVSGLLNSLGLTSLAISLCRAGL